MHNIFSRVRHYNIYVIMTCHCKIMLTDNELALYRSTLNWNIVIIIVSLWFSRVNNACYYLINKLKLKRNQGAIIFDLNWDSTHSQNTHNTKTKLAAATYPTPWIGCSTRTWRGHHHTNIKILKKYQILQPNITEQKIVTNGHRHRC